MLIHLDEYSGCLEGTYTNSDRDLDRHFQGSVLANGLSELSMRNISQAGEIKAFFREEVG